MVLCDALCFNGERRVAKKRRRFLTNHAWTASTFCWAISRCIKCVSKRVSASAASRTKQLAISHTAGSSTTHGASPKHSRTASPYNSPFISCIPMTEYFTSLMILLNDYYNFVGKRSRSVFLRRTAQPRRLSIAQSANSMIA